MYEMCHPVFYEMSKLGCTDDSKYTLAFQTYMELCEVKRLWDVNYKYNKALDLIYLEARDSKSSPLNKYIPWPAMNAMSLDRIEIMQKELETDRLIFVFKDGDSTSVYYTVTAGLVKPLSPEQSKEFKRHQGKKAELESEIRKNASNLYELAMSVKSEADPTNEAPAKD
ncbi:uncharacterized protein LOC105693073 [Athalia rosae]|uniref:uncharacterized protein LOC105693073 n=1 Tax=Athalia rosae TaxID=37344 RepID=UPI0020331CAD|nr:uncharacterized protein LOC105693073 [Athalia rosae]